MGISGNTIYIYICNGNYTGKKSLIKEENETGGEKRKFNGLRRMDDNRIGFAFC